MLPQTTSRLRFREMTNADLDLMVVLLGDPEVMEFYPEPKTREGVMRWIEWNQTNYAEYGYGLWIIETHNGDFVGDCGLTWQTIDGQRFLELGYHTVHRLQGQGYATEAGRACLELAHGPIAESHVVAIINPENTPSRRVAEKLGMDVELAADYHGSPAVVYGRRDGSSH